MELCHCCHSTHRINFIEVGYNKLYLSAEVTLREAVGGRLLVIFHFALAKPKGGQSGLD